MILRIESRFYYLDFAIRNTRKVSSLVLDIIGLWVGSFVFLGTYLTHRAVHPIHGRWIRVSYVERD